MPFGDQSWTGQIIWMLLFFTFILMYPKYMLYKIVSELEEVAETLEGYTRNAVDIIVKTASEKGKPPEDPRKTVLNAIEFFIISPVSLDPYGILKKIEHLIDRAEDKFESIADKIAPKSDKVWRANTISLVKGGIGVNTIAKIVRHYVEFVKKTGNFQIAMIIQMNMPIIKKIAKAQMDGVKAISEGKPIGDGIGPMVAASLIDGKCSSIARDIIVRERKIGGKKVFVVKADGPGANLGKFGDAVQNIAKKNKIAKIITVDATVKLEGEKSGSVAEGMGAAIGDPGPEKAKMEEIALKNNIPLEAYVIKMSIEEAISPLTSDIAKSVENAVEFLRDSISTTKGSVILVGVGNTCGIGNSKKSLEGLKLPEKKEEKPELGVSDKIIKLLVKKPPKKRPKKS